MDEELEEDGGLLDAIDEGLNDADPEAEEPDEPTPDTPEPEGGDEPESGDEPDSDDGAEPDKEGADGGEEKSEPPDGDGEEKPASAEPEAEKPSDQFGELDKDTPQKTRDRFNSLKQGYDDVVSERDAMQAEMNGWRESIQGTGTNPEQFGMALSYLKAVNSGTREGLEQAFGIMQNEMAAIAKMLGKTAPGLYDVLDDYPDLKQRVNDGDLSEKDAHELAAARSSQRFDEARNQTQQQQQASEQAVQKALDGVRALGQRLEANDPLFAQKRQFLEPIVATAVESGLPPEKWVPMIERAYRALRLPNVAAPTKPNAPTPMRPSGPSPAATNLEKEAGSELEAIDIALSRGW